MTWEQKTPHEGYRFSVLHGPTYDEAHRPPIWVNELPLLPDVYVVANPPDMECLPLERFPMIDDFEVRLMITHDSSGRPLGSYQVEFASSTLGTLASFPYWSSVETDLRRDDFTPPLGTFEEPCYDVDQGWEIIIAERGIFVYIIEGTFDQRAFDGYDAWFKVRKARYLEQWDRAITAIRQLTTTAVP